MDIATVIGIVLCIGAVIGSILAGGDLMAFIDIPSVIVVGLGVIGVTFTKWPMEIVTKVAAIAMKSVFFTPANPKDTIEEIGKLAETARRESVFALEKQPIDDQFMKKAMTLAADNRPPEVISAILQLEIDALEERHKIGADVFSGMADDGPAFGMIGTLIGLVIMLGNLSDQAAIGPAMAVALLTTFYGACIANIFCNPIKNKLAYRSSMEAQKMSIIIAGTLGIVAGENPRLIKEKLNSFLPPAEREVDDAGGEE
ncbi:MotA/TolQ/ExbB proton channel family protein [Bacteriovoracaceae bacterium]|nr:MotA/TolQ/ExbB proton channel family protein [Bacteriovoracaceae bacterium]|tara:strand:- start:21394 stop:22164 length:771 start_codon:yes stop_codon:yes gene_type:complete